MRVIAGKYKGHRLTSFSAGHIRPTTDRVKETVFNKLMGHCEGAAVLDLFSGTGNLAIEALSRGASSVIAVESNRKSIRIIGENLSKLKIAEGIRVVDQDVFKFLVAYEGPGFDIIFADPPFTQKIAHEVMLAIAASKALGAQTMVVIESSSRERIDDAYEPLVLLDRRKFGDKSASFFTCRA